MIATHNVNIKDGEVTIMSEEEYDGMKATFKLSSNIKLCKKILNGKKTSLKECKNIDEIDW